MAIRRIRIIGEPVLRKKAKKVNKVTPLILQLLDDMAETMNDARGIGLAAPQVGVSKRVVVVNIEEELYKLINPKVIESEGNELGLEGCLSIPGLIGDVERAVRVVIKAMNPEGKYIKIEAADLLARVFLHEIDHLDGILYVDMATNMREVEEGEEEMAEKEAGMKTQMEKESERESEKESEKEKKPISANMRSQPKAIFEL